MKPSLERISIKAASSFSLKVIERQHRRHLSQAWHFHPELEICYTAVSHGKRFVGNQISDYQKRDLVMFGANLPHGFITDVASRQVVIQFKPDFLGLQFLSKPEMNPLTALFNRAKAGIEFGPVVKETAIKVITDLSQADGLRQVVLLLELMELLATTADYKEICPDIYTVELNRTNLTKMKVVYDYILSNISGDINLGSVADLLNMTESNFYKFIRKNTKKTFTQLVNEFRINKAAKEIINTNRTIAEIAYDCGYNNISYFNKRFKALMHKTPLEFRRHFQP